MSPSLSHLTTSTLLSRLAHPTSETVAAALDRWLSWCHGRTQLAEGHSERLSERTLQAYRYSASKLVAHCGSMPLDGLTENNILDALETLPDGSWHTVGTSWQSALSFLGHQVMPPRKVFVRRPQPQIWVEDDYPAAWAALLDRHQRIQSLRRPAQVSRCSLMVAATGMRVGEAVTMRREWVGPCTVLRTRVPPGWAMIKGKTGPRLLPIGPEARRVLQECPSEGWLFPSGRRGSKKPHVLESSVAHCVRKACDAHGLPHVHTHALRHMLASHLAARGVPLATIAAVLGNGVVITERYYVHTGMRQAEQAMRLASDGLTRGQLSLLGPR